MELIKLMVIIIRKGKGPLLIDYLKKQGLPFFFSCSGQGTVESRLQFYLGISNTDKDVIFAPIKAKLIKKTLLGIDKIAKITEKGNGVAFTIPLTSIISNLSVDYLESNLKTGGNKNGR